MPYLLEDLVIDRVDFVDEGANSAAFIELYKRKELPATMDAKEILSKMKPEHASVVQAELDSATSEVTKANDSLANVNAELETTKASLQTANDELAKANSELELLKAKTPCDCDGEADDEGVCKGCGRTKKGFDEATVLKGMPAEARAIFEKMRAQKEAAEEEVRKAKEAEKHSDAIAKAASLKALPVEEAKLVEVVKSCSTEMLDMLTSINAAIESSVLTEVGKSASKGGAIAADAWGKIETKAGEIAKRDGITKAKAIASAIKENPELYKEYLEGGAN